MKTYGQVDVKKIHIFLIPVLFAEWSASGIGRFTLGKKFPYAYLINNYSMKAYWGVDGTIHVSLPPVFVAECLVSDLGPFNPEEIVPIFI
jgi:hypothetical protein